MTMSMELDKKSLGKVPEALHSAKDHSAVQSIKTDRAIGGAAMDRKVAKSRWQRTQRWLPMLAGAMVLLVLLGYIAIESRDRSYSIGSNQVLVAPVTRGVFEDFIPIRGRVTPKKTVYLDAVEGGQVEQRLVEDGAMVAEGDLIVVLSNSTLQLDVVRNEAIVTEQLNNMRSLELQLEQNRLQHRRTLVDSDYQIQRLGRQVSRLSDLDKRGVASKSLLEDAIDELTYQRASRQVTLESQATDARLQVSQLEFLRNSAEQLERSLTISRNNLDALNVRAPIAGKVSGLIVEVGQSIARGGRIGQLDDPANFKLRAGLDEYYLNRVDIGQSAFFDRNGATYELTVSKLYPQVKNGQFEIDLLFVGAEPSQIRRGQTLQGKLTLGDPAPARLIPNGAFYQDTGGNWLFVLSPDGTQALRRNVKVGRRNARFIEVLDGLDVGERVITSSYGSFGEIDRLKLTQD
jgi:HlyD family secretion protein